MDDVHDIVFNNGAEETGSSDGMNTSDQAERERSKQCCAELRGLKEQYAYLASDLENVRRRAERERAQLIRSTQERMLRDMLNVMDDLERALVQLTTTAEVSSEQCVAGIQLVQRNFAQMLERYGVTELTQMSHFDPHIHEAIAQVAREDAASGTIIDVFEKGYKLHGELLRPARVSVVA